MKTRTRPSCLLCPSCNSDLYLVIQAMHFPEPEEEEAEEPPQPDPAEGSPRSTASSLPSTLELSPPRERP